MPPSKTVVSVAHIVYALHAVSLAIGAFGAASVIGTFLFGWPSIIAVVLNYYYRSEARDTWVDSHFSWQIRTFWYAAAWSLVVSLISLVLAIVLIGIATWIVGLFALGVWAVVRIARGWLRLRDQQPI